MRLLDFWKMLFSRGQPKKKKSRRKIKKRTVRSSQKKIQEETHKKFRKRAKKRTSKKAQKKSGNKIQKKLRKPAQPKKLKKSQKCPKKPEKKLKEKEIGLITHYFGKISVGIIKLKSGLKVGDAIHIKGACDDFIQLVTSMQVNHKNVSSARKGDEIGIKFVQRVHENDRVYGL